MAEIRRELILVDGSGYIFRAFFALPQLNNSRGMPTNAVYGFIRMLLKLLKEERPTHIAVVFDSPKKTFRDDLFQDYKANRPQMPNDLGVQIPYIRRAVDSFRIHTIVLDGYEADDVIGTLAARAQKERFDTVIVTEDKDFMQLVTPRVTLWRTMSDKRLGVKDVRDRFGVEPKALIDIYALTGDAIDNVKGIPGIGEKTASALVQKFGSLAGILGNIDAVEQMSASELRGAKKVAALLREHRASAELARKLVAIDCEVPLDTQPDDFAWHGIDQAAVAELLRELEFNSMLAELAPASAAPAVSAGEETTVDAPQLPSIVAELKKAERIAFDLATDPTAGDRMQIHAGATTYAFGGEAIGGVKQVLESESPAKSCHDLKEHLRSLAKLGIALRGVDFDTMLAGFLINSGRTEPELDDLYHEHLAPLGDDSTRGTNAALVAALRVAMTPKLEAAGLMPLFRDIELPIAVILGEMEQVGVAIDASALRTTSTEFGLDIARLEDECYRLAGRKFNLNSPNQLREVLFTDLKLSAKGLKKTKSGFSTDADALEKLAAAHPLPAKLIEYRALAKLKSTYADSLGELIDARDGRLHTTFHQALAATGRVSSSDPNLQNIPTRTEAGLRIRRAFVAREGCSLLSADYSQIDLRVLAHLSGEPTLVEAFQRGEDIHVRTATELLGLTADKVDTNARRVAKTINFGIIYGMGPQRLANELGIPLATASDYIRRYFEQLPGVRAWFESTLAHGRETGYVATMYGRRRYLPELNAPPGGSRAQAERIAVNTPIQGTSADLIKIAMIRLHSWIRASGIETRMIMQVHDELLLEVPKAALGDVASAARREMEGVAALKVPLKVDTKSGPNWAEMSVNR